MDECGDKAPKKSYDLKDRTALFGESVVDCLNGLNPRRDAAPWSAAVYTAAFLAAKHGFAAARREYGSRIPKGGFAAVNKMRFCAFVLALSLSTGSTGSTGSTVVDKV